MLYENKDDYHTFLRVCVGVYAFIFIIVIKLFVFNFSLRAYLHTFFIGGSHTSVKEIVVLF